MNDFEKNVLLFNEDYFYRINSMKYPNIDSKKFILEYKKNQFEMEYHRDNDFNQLHKCINVLYLILGSKKCNHFEIKNFNLIRFIMKGCDLLIREIFFQQKLSSKFTYLDYLDYSKCHHSLFTKTILPDELFISIGIQSKKQYISDVGTLINLLLYKLNSIGSITYEYYCIKCEDINFKHKSELQFENEIRLFYDIRQCKIIHNIKDCVLNELHRNYINKFILVFENYVDWKKVFRYVGHCNYCNKKLWKIDISNFRYEYIIFTRELRLYKMPIVHFDCKYEDNKIINENIYNNRLVDKYENLIVKIVANNNIKLYDKNLCKILDKYKLYHLLPKQNLLLLLNYENKKRINYYFLFHQLKKEMNVKQNNFFKLITKFLF